VAKGPITSVEQVTPDWLTHVLYECGVLPQGGAIQVTAGPSQSTFASLTWHLDVRYSAETSPDAPAKLFLKCSRADLAPGECDPDKLR